MTRVQLHAEERIVVRLTEGLAGDYLPFTMVVNARFELLHMVGDGSRYLRFPPGRVVNEVSKLADRDLAIPLGTGLKKALRTNEDLTYTNIHLSDGEEELVVNMRLKPLPAKKGQAPLISVLIDHVRDKVSLENPKIEAYDVGRHAERRITDLENELRQDVFARLRSRCPLAGEPGWPWLRRFTCAAAGATIR